MQMPCYQRSCAINIYLVYKLHVSPVFLQSFLKFFSGAGFLDFSRKVIPKKATLYKSEFVPW